MYTEIGLIASALQGGDLTGKGIEREPQAAQPESATKMRPKTTTGWLGKFLGLSVVSMLQNVFAQLFLWLLAFAIVSAIIVLGANKFDTHEEGSHNGRTHNSRFVVTGPNSHHGSWCQEDVRETCHCS